jgi:hypothetical protein
MSPTEISQLSLREKFQVMEAIWVDLHDRLASSKDIPQSHKDLLNARRQRVQCGEAVLREWDQVKHSIGQK